MTDHVLNRLFKFSTTQLPIRELPSKSSRFAVAAVSVAGALILGLLAGCNGSSGGSAQSATLTSAASSSLIAIDGKHQRGYVPLTDLNSNLHGQVAVLDLGVNPDQKNALLKIIDIGLIALPRAAAVDVADGTLLVLADNVLNTGTLLLINTADDSITPVSFPTGSRPSETSGVVVDPKKKIAVVTMSDAVNDCTGDPGSCTGVSVFDLAGKTFGPLIASGVDINSVALNSRNGMALGSVDPFVFLWAFDLPVAEAIPCELDDENLSKLLADPEAIGVDPATEIWVVGNYESPIASVINLHGAQFVNPGSQDCHLDEGGTPPNSVNFDTGTGAEGMPGVVINPNTHLALLTAQGSNNIALLRLPSAPVKQLTASRIKGVHAMVPNDPMGLPFDPANFPYGNGIDTERNLAYVVDNARTFLAQINLSKFRHDPGAIGTALEAGSCAGVTTSFKCDNGHGIRFFPLPDFAGGATAHLPAAFGARARAFTATRSAKRRGQ